MIVETVDGKEIVYVNHKQIKGILRRREKRARSGLNRKPLRHRRDAHRMRTSRGTFRTAPASSSSPPPVVLPQPIIEEPSPEPSKGPEVTHGQLYTPAAIPDASNAEQFTELVRSQAQAINVQVGKFLSATLTPCAG